MIGCWKDFFPECANRVGGDPAELGISLESRYKGAESRHRLAESVWRAREAAPAEGGGISAGGFLPGSRVGSLEAPGWLAAGRRAEWGRRPAFSHPSLIPPTPTPAWSDWGRSPHPYTESEVWWRP